MTLKQTKRTASFFQDIQTHKTIAARALLIGWGLWISSLLCSFLGRASTFVILFASSVLLVGILLLGHLSFRVGFSAAYPVAERVVVYLAVSVAGILIGGGLVRDNSAREQSSAPAYRKPTTG